MTQPVLAAQLYTVRQFCQDARSLAETFSKVRAMGYTSVQISGIGPIPHAEVKAMLDENGLSCCVTHVRLPWPWQDVDTIIAQHKLWNCQHVGLGAMPDEYRQSEEGFERFVAQANAIDARLRQAGLTFNYHNHNFEMVRFGRRTGLDLLIQEASMNFILDTYWIQHGGGDPAAWIKKLAGRMPVVHLKDMAFRENRPCMAEVGEGNLNWPAILSACREAGVEWYAVEQDADFSRDAFDSLQISYNNLKVMGLE
jgi:sugar phosphate isomerase/epimerase